MLVAEHLPPDLERFAMQRLGPLIQSLILIDASELRQRHRDVAMLAEQGAPDAERPFQRLAGGAIVPLVGQHHAQVVERLRDLHVLGAEGLPPAGERLFEQLLRLIVDARAGDRSCPSP